jgi:hypothetical protein
VRTDQPGPLSEDERALLDGFLAHDFLGVEELREQAPHVMAEKGCDCGCGTISFVLDASPMPHSASRSPVPVDGYVRAADGEEVGGLILFLDEGMLAALEVYSYDDPLPLPSPEQVRWHARP